MKSLRTTPRRPLSLNLFACCAASPLMLVPVTQADAAEVVWTNMVNVVENAGVLSKSTGNAWTAGAVSQNSVTSGNAFVQFTTLERNKSKIAGLGFGNTDTGHADVEHAVYMRYDGVLILRQGGSDLAQFGQYQPNDVFRVERLDGEIRYLHNGAVIYSSAPAQSSSTDLRLDTSFADNGATIANAWFGTCVAGEADSYGDAGYEGDGFDTAGYETDGFDTAGYEADGFDTAGYETDGFDTAGYEADGFDTAGYHEEGLELDAPYCIVPGMWTHVQGVRASGNTLTRIMTNVPYTGASTFASFAGDGYVEFSSLEANTSKFAGLGILDTTRSYSDIAHGMLLRHDGVLELWESNVSLGQFGSYTPADRFRVEVLGNEVRYVKNGMVFHSTLRTSMPATGWVLDTSLASMGSTLVNNLIHECSPLDEASGTTRPCIEPGYFTHVKGAMVKGRDLNRVSVSSVAGASSFDMLGSSGPENGYVEFSTNETTTAKTAGLGNNDQNTSAADIDYGILLRGDRVIEVTEDGQSKGQFGTYQAGDRFRVQVVNGTVKYLRNGTVFYQSIQPVVWPLAFDSSLASAKTSLTDVDLVHGGM